MLPQHNHFSTKDERKKRHGEVEGFQRAEAEQG